MVLGFLSASGYNTVVLDATIIPDGKTAECRNISILRSFKEAGTLLDDWSKITEEMYKDYPNVQDLLQLIPKGDGLSLSKSNKANVMTDTCNTPYKRRLMLSTTMMQALKEAGIDYKYIKVFIGDCWHHLRCI